MLQAPSTENLFNPFLSSIQLLLELVNLLLLFLSVIVPVKLSIYTVPKLLASVIDKGSLLVVVFVKVIFLLDILLKVITGL